MKLNPNVFTYAAEVVDNGKGRSYSSRCKGWKHLPSCFAIEVAAKEFKVPAKEYRDYFHNVYFNNRSSEDTYLYRSNSPSGAYFGYGHCSSADPELANDVKQHRVNALLFAAEMLRQEQKVERIAKPGVEYKWTRNPKNMKGGIPRNLRPESVVTYKMNYPTDDFTDKQCANNLDWSNNITESARIAAYKVIEY